MSVNEQVLRGASHPAMSTVSNTTAGVAFTLRVEPVPHQEMWWFTDTGSLSTEDLDSTATIQGARIKPGAPAVVSLLNTTGRLDLFGNTAPTCARLSLATKDNALIGRLEAVSAEGLADLTLKFASLGGSPGYQLSSIQGESHDYTVIRNAFEEVYDKARNVPLGVDDDMYAVGKAVASGQHGDVEIHLHPKYSLIDVSYASNGGAGFATKLMLKADAEMSYTLLSNEGTPANLDKSAGRVNAGSNVNLLSSNYYGVYGRVTFAQMAGGNWQGWVRAYSAVEKFSEGVFVVHASGGVAPTVTLAVPATANKLAYTHRAYLK